MSANTNDQTWQYTQMTAAALFAILLFVPILLAGLPRFTRAAFPGPLGREDAVLLFFIGVPLVFSVFAAYRVAQYHGVVGGNREE